MTVRDSRELGDSAELGANQACCGVSPARIALASTVGPRRRGTKSCGTWKLVGASAEKRVVALASVSPKGAEEADEKTSGATGSPGAFLRAIVRAGVV